MRIAVTGYYGFSNFGDELFVIATEYGANEYWRGHELLFVSPPVIGSKAAFIVPGWYPKEVYASLGLMGKLSRMLFLMVAFLRSDAILHAGGSTISSDASDAKFKLVSSIRRFVQKRVFGIGLSIGPFATDQDRRSAKELLMGFERLCVRDGSSCELAKELLPDRSVACTADLAGVIAQAHHYDEVDKSPDIIGVSLMSFASTDKDMYGRRIDLEASMMAIREFAIAHKKKIRVFVLNTHPDNGDIAVSDMFIAMLSASDVEYERVTSQIGPLKVWESIAGCSSMISHRLHGAIAAYLAAVPFYLLEYHQKCTVFLDDIGVNRSKTESSLPAITEEIVRSLHTASSPKVSISEYRSKAMDNFAKMSF